MDDQINLKVLGPIIWAAVFLLNVNSVSAYQCNQPRSLNEEIDLSSVIFSGTVREIQAVDENLFKVTFDVQKTFKGKPASSIELFTDYLGGGQTPCGPRTEQGKEYLVFGYLEKDSLSFRTCSRGIGVRWCGRTNYIREAGDDLKELEKLLRN